MTNKIISKPQALFSITIILLIIALVFFFLSNSKSNIKYVDNTKLFNEFLMTKELVKVGENIYNAQKKRLDTLYLKLNQCKDDKSKIIVIDKINMQKQSISDFNTNYNLKNSEKIWKRINQYLKEFSEINNYDLIIGTQNDGAFAGNSKLEITTQAVDYINRKYEGNN